MLAALLAAGQEHLTAEDLAERIGAEHPAIHLSTIYRTLDALTEAELITVARFADKPVTFHLVDDVHHHAVCSRCGTTLDLAPSVFEGVRRHLLETSGFHAEPRHLTIPGECRDCHAARGGGRRVDRPG